MVLVTFILTEKPLAKYIPTTQKMQSEIVSDEPCISVLLPLLRSAFLFILAIHNWLLFWDVEQLG